MRARTPIAILAGLMLASCQPPGYDITLVYYDGGPVLEARGDGIWPFAWEDSTIDAGAVEIADRDTVVWRIVVRDGCGERRTNPFPLRIGTAPRCFKEAVPFRGLRLNTLYRVTGDGLRRGSSYFRIVPRISNHSWSEVQDELQGWPPAARGDLIEIEGNEIEQVQR